jgi:hypothetical protein
MLRDVLNLHPDVYIPQETHWIPKMDEVFGIGTYAAEELAEITERTFYHDGTCVLDAILEDFPFGREELHTLVRAALGDPRAATVAEFNQAFFSVLAKHKAASRWGDKTPEYGFYMSLLQRLWPEARFVHVIRDGRDVALSMAQHAGFRRMLELRIHDWIPVSFDRYYEVGRAQPSPAVRALWRGLRKPIGAIVRPLRGRTPVPPTDDPLLESFATLWERRLRRISEEARRVDRSRYLELRYEDALALPAESLRRVADFLGLTPSERWLARAVDSLRRDNSRKLVNTPRYPLLTNRIRGTLTRYGYE